MSEDKTMMDVEPCNTCANLVPIKWKCKAGKPIDMGKVVYCGTYEDTPDPDERYEELERIIKELILCLEHSEQVLDWHSLILSFKVQLMMLGVDFETEK